jgi:mRNA-degrading endonuclease RelE of RelBE toxin-antitoxin system
MRIVETRIFTKTLRGLLDEEDYRALQLALVLRPEQGALIPGAGGLRKVRWGIEGKGKRGGVRIIYFWDPKQAVLYMLLVYGKTVQDDLTPTQLLTLSRLVREEFK